MKNVFARALLASALLALPSAALASTKGEAKVSAKADKAAGKPEQAAKAGKLKHGHSLASVTKKEPTAKKTRVHAHSAKPGKGVAAAPPSASTKAH